MTSPGDAAATALVQRLGVFIDPELLVLALTHRSFAYEAGGLPTNERLEFLGDSVLGIVVTDRLYRSHPDLDEGDLAKMRSACVSQRALAEVAREIDLGPCILLGKGEIATDGPDKDSILCDAFEALLGAIYLSNGIETSSEVDPPPSGSEPRPRGGVRGEPRLEDLAPGSVRLARPRQSRLRGHGSRARSLPHLHGHRPHRRSASGDRIRHRKEARGARRGCHRVCVDHGRHAVMVAPKRLTLPGNR